MNATEFLRAFHTQVNRVRPTGYSGEWSVGMYRVLERIGKAAGYQVNHRNRHGEINNIDFCYTVRDGRPSTNWNPPCVVIEHENAWHVEETKWDFWKSCLYAVPLRITIGYKAREDQALAVGKELMDFYSRWRLRQLTTGETLLIMGWVQEPGPRQWLYWRLRGRSRKATQGRLK